VQDAFIRAFRKRAASGKSMSLVVPLNPVPASRPRISRYGGVHYLKRYSDWKKAAVHSLRSKDKPYFPDKPVAVMVEHIIRRPKTTKLRYPKCDVDNLDKAIFDALTSCKCIWTDDDQILMSLSFKRFTQPNEDEGTKVTIIELCSKT